MSFTRKISRIATDINALPAILWWLSLFKSSIILWTTIHLWSHLWKKENTLPEKSSLEGLGSSCVSPYPSLLARTQHDTLRWTCKKQMGKSCVMNITRTCDVKMCSWLCSCLSATFSFCCRGMLRKTAAAKRGGLTEKEWEKLHFHHRLVGEMLTGPKTQDGYLR